MSERNVEMIVTAWILSALGLITAWIIWVLAVNMRKSRNAKRVVDLHSKLLDRFSSASELTAYLEGSAGSRFFESLSPERYDLRNRLLSTTQAGLVLLLLGLALVGLRPTQEEQWLRQVLLLAGVPTATVGGALLLSALAILGLSRWGLPDERSKRG